MPNRQFCFLILRFFLSIFLIFDTLLFPHGFHKDTIVRYGNSSTIISLNNIATKVKHRTRQYVASYDVQKNEWTSKRVRAAGFSHVPFYCTLSFNGSVGPDVVCSPTQHFYRLSDRQWVPVHKLTLGDRLLCQKNNFVVVSAIEIIQQPLTVYTIQVKETHTFLVGNYGVLAHNIIIPVAATIGASIPFSTGCGGGVGAIFGPAGFACGILIGSAIGVAVNGCLKDKFVEYNVGLQSCEISSFVYAKDNSSKGKDNKESDKKSSEAQAPGKPTENDGFVPKKNWSGEKVKHRRGYGWPDKKGSVWIPSGPNGHGGPHWDVQHPDGSYDNIVPGERIRGQK